MNLPKRSSFKRLLKVYTLSKILLWIKPSYFSLENVCDSWCIHQTGLFWPLCHKVNALSCVAWRSWFYKVNLPRCETRGRHFIVHDLWYFRQRTNEHFSSMLFICKTWPAHSSATQVTDINTLDQMTGKVVDVSRTHISLTFHWRLWWFPWNVWNWEVVSVNQCSNTIIVPRRSPQEIWSGLGRFLISSQVKKTCQLVTVSFHSKFQ